MKIAMMGAGGVGGYYGARLTRAGHDVSFVARGAHAEAMLRSGLHVRSELGDIDLSPVTVVTDAREIGSVDLIVVAVKLWDTEAAARAILPMMGPATTVVSLQNGVGKDDVIGGVAGREHMVGGVTYVMAYRTGPGVIAHTGRLHRIVVGELDGGPSKRADAVVNAFTLGGIEAAASLDIRRDIWEKFAFLVASSAVTAVTRLTIGALRAHPATRALLRDAMHEAVALARAEGVAITDDFVDGRLRFIDTLPPDGRASMAQDLLRGARLELDWLSGDVVRRSERFGLPAPVHRALYAALALYAEGAPAESAESR